MNTARWIAGLLGLGLGVQASALAYGGSADFWLDPLPLTSAGEVAAPGNAGTWITDNQFYGDIFTLHHVQGQADPVARYETFSGQDLGLPAISGAPFGHLDKAYPALPGQPMLAEAHVQPGHIGTRWDMPDADDRAHAQIAWGRSYVLDPHTSLTLSGLAVLANDSPATPGAMAPRPIFVQFPSWRDDMPTMAELSFRDGALVDNNVSLTASILDYDPRDPWSPQQGRVPSAEDFSYGGDTAGHLSLTVNNRSDQVMYGIFQVFVTAEPTTPIPEPSAWAMMVLGLAGLGAWTRSRAGFAPGARARGCVAEQAA